MGYFVLYMLIFYLITVVVMVAVMFDTIISQISLQCELTSPDFPLPLSDLVGKTPTGPLRTRPVQQTQPELLYCSLTVCHLADIKANEIINNDLIIAYKGWMDSGSRQSVSKHSWVLGLDHLKAGLHTQSE